MSFAYGTKVATPEGFRPIEQYERGDPVLAASRAGGGVEWTIRQVGFSQGTGPHSQEAAMLYLRVGDAEPLIATTDQLFLLADGRFERGDRLEPGKDRLAGADGAKVPILAISLGAYQGGVHHISAGPSWEGSPDGHLLNIAGLIAADFLLEMHGGDLSP